jgi:Tfp pilus assembly protein FimT
MKCIKIILGSLAVLAIAAVAAWNVSVNLNSQDNSELSDIQLANVEALAQESTTGNTGPGQVVDCGGWGTGSKKVCLCSNSHPCTESPCS